MLVALPAATRAPTEFPVSMSVRPSPEGRLPWRYGLLSLPLLAAFGVSYWGYGQWRARQARGRDFNPYICGPPIHDERMFFGRTELLREILQVIHNNNIIIYGERRIGKTTLLYQLGQRLQRLEDPEYAFFPVFINLQGIPQDRLFLLVGQSVARQMEDEIGTLGLICSSGSRREGALFSPTAVSLWQSSRTSYSNFDLQEDLTMVVQALQQVTPKAVRLILLVDEADVINTYDQTVQEQLRGILMSSLAQHIKMVIAGTYISKEWHLQSSPWYNLFSREIMVPPFDEGELKRLIQRPVEGVYRYDQDAIEQIIAYSDRKPFEAQQLCLHAVRETLAQKKRHVTTSEVEVALKSSLEERSLEFEQLWEAMSPDGQRALEVLMKNAPRGSADRSQGNGKDVAELSRFAVSRLPLSDEDRRLLLQGGVLYRYERRERLLTSFQEWIKRALS
jgi:Cdc6-like AAA superfamily ATPase